jgi:GWxTD domain-containing protein
MSIRSVLATLILTTTAMSGQFATPGRGEVRYSIDTAVFRSGLADTLILEVYQEVPVENLARSPEGISSFTTEVALMNPEGDTLAYTAWRSETEWVSGRSVINAVILPVCPGERVLSVTVTDDLNGLQGTAVRTLSVSEPRWFSEVEIARTIMPAPPESESSLRKGGILVFPAASNTFTVPGETRVYTYQEIYDLGGTTFSRQTGIRGPDGRPVYARPPETLSIPPGLNSVSLADSLDLLPARVSGLYSLFVLYTAENGDTLGFFTKPMLVEATVADDLYELPDVHEEMPYLDQLSLLLSGSQAELYARLDESGRALFYRQFWLNSPEERAAFEARCRATDRFSYQERAGWLTDRGRVYIRYGEPGDVERSPFTTTHVPYEMWHYFEGGNFMFVFADLSKNGDYRQVHSTVQGEITFPNWRDMIRIGGMGSSGSGFDEW